MVRALYLLYVYAAIGFWTVMLAPSALIVLLVSGSHRACHWLHARLWGKLILSSCGVRLRVHGLDRLDPGGSYVFMVNHGSHFSGCAVAAALPFQWRAELARQLRALPILSRIVRLAGHLFVESEAEPGRAADAGADGHLASGISVLVFPEGAPYDDLGPLPFRRGGFELAIRAGAHIVPLTVVESRRPTAPGRLIDLFVDHPLPAAEHGAAEISRLMRSVSSSMQRHLQPGRRQTESSDWPAIAPTQTAH